MTEVLRWLPEHLAVKCVAAPPDGYTDKYPGSAHYCFGAKEGEMNLGEKRMFLRHAADLSGRSFAQVPKRDATDFLVWVRLDGLTFIRRQSHLKLVDPSRR